MNGLVKFALGVAGLSPEVVADIDKSLPGTARLIDAVKLLQPILAQAQPHIEAITPQVQAMLPHIEALIPLLNKALPIIKAEYPDIIALLPTAKEIIAFVGDQKVARVASSPDASRQGGG